MAKTKKNDEVVEELSQKELEAKFSGENEPAEKEAKKIKIKSKSNFSLKDYQKEIKIPIVNYKPDSWIPMSKAFMETTQLPGIPEGRVIACWGFEDSGKSTVALELMANAQQRGVLPILINTEKKFNWEHAETMGVDKDNMIYVDSLETVEECCEFIKERLKDQKEGRLPTDIVFVWDSIGNVISGAELRADEKGDTSAIMATAKLLTQQIHRIIEKRISDTRKEEYPYNATLFVVNHAYQGTMANTLTPYGGRGVLKAATLSIRMGGILSNSTKCYAVKDGVEMAYAIKTSIVVEKNHITNVSVKAKIICTAHGFIMDSKESIDEYKKQHKDSWELKFAKDWDKYGND